MRLVFFIFFLKFFIDAKTDFDFRYNYGCDDPHGERGGGGERMTLVVPKSRSLVLRMRWETVAPYGAVWCGFTRVPMPYALSVMPVRLVGHTWGKKKKEKEGEKKEKQQLDMNACASKQTNQRAVMFVGR